MRLEERIKKYEYKLNETDEQIIEYIVINKEEVAGTTLKKLATQTFTVPNTIVRLAKKLDYESFSHFKLQLKEELCNQEKSQDALFDSVAKTMELLDEDCLDKVCKALAKSRKVACFAVGDTAPFGRALSRYLKNLGVKSSFYPYRNEIEEELKNSEIVFLLSLSGETKQVIEIAQAAKSLGIKVFSMTHFSENSLSKLADIRLYCFSPNEKKTPLMFLIEYLINYYNTCV